MIKIIIKGRTPSKKNSKTMVCKGNRPILLPSNNYSKWHKDASLQIKQQNIQSIKGRIDKVVATFYAPDNRKFDLSNKFESIADLLVDNGIIEDDNYNIIPDVHMIFGGVDKTNPRVEIILL